MKTTHKNLLELAARWHVFIMLNIYGLGKLMGGQFYRKGALPAEIAEQTLGTVGSFDLAWTFMGHSYAYILFIGISQLIGAWLLLWDKTKFIGITILIPILVNIIVFDAIFFDTYGAMASAILYLSLLLLVVFLNKEKLLEVLRIITDNKPSTFSGSAKEKLKTAGVVILMMAAFFGFDQLWVNLLGH